MGVMTPARGSARNRHDTLGAVTARSGKGTARQTFRIEKDEWDELGKKAAEKGADRSAVLRALIRWYNGKPGAELPDRPTPEPSE